mmetsp:Transcript_34438/g.83031  ORF Transcript_34438/g.83031 Transcript_34438/m.83031 type:complete len:233 (+) Transcript_34438:110-808(+)
MFRGRNRPKAYFMQTRTMTTIKMTRTIMLMVMAGAVVMTMTTTTTEVEAFNFLTPLQQPQREQLKSDILELATEVDRGLTATESQQEQMKSLFEKLEKLNPTSSPLKSSKLIDGSWDLQYTTSDSILGKGGFPRIGPIEQFLDTSNLQAYNSEVVNYFGFLPIQRKVTASLQPQSSQLTAVQFEQFEIGSEPFQIKIKAPSQFQGSLDITYLDDNLRLTRGDKGNIFVLTRM